MDAAVFVVPISLLSTDCDIVLMISEVFTSKSRLFMLRFAESLFLKPTISEGVWDSIFP